MNKSPLVFWSVGIVGAILAIASGVFYADSHRPSSIIHKFESPMGNFLAAQHAAAIGDFDMAAQLTAEMQDSEIKLARESAVSAAFLAGRGDINFAALAGDNHPASKIIYLVHLANTGEWADARKLFASDKSVIFSPFRIWPAVAENHITETIKFVNSSYGSDAWKSFVRGQIYAARGDTERAASEFSDVPTDFMNLADYEYIMNFYTAHDMMGRADELHKKYTSQPSSAYLADRREAAGWGYSYAKNMAFSLVQIVSHRPEANGTITGLMLLRAAEQLGGDASLDYYLGNYFYELGDMKNADKYWERLGQGDAFYPFVLLKRADAAGDLSERNRARERVIREFPAFIPAIVKNYAENIDAGDDAAALRGIDIALDAEIPIVVRNYLNALKRAQAMAEGQESGIRNQEPVSDFDYDTCPTIDALGGGE